eukprot:GHVT01089887.1.p1 GENE.GHVT01089887.1~~GHVT01089887.1.p1  ORF type:complete len:996 (-),score=121.42 GHVT01089887.1:4814-7801(-)
MQVQQLSNTVEKLASPQALQPAVPPAPQSGNEGRGFHSWIDRAAPTTSPNSSAWATTYAAAAAVPAADLPSEMHAPSPTTPDLKANEESPSPKSAAQGKTFCRRVPLQQAPIDEAVEDAAVGTFSFAAEQSKLYGKTVSDAGPPSDVGKSLYPPVPSDLMCRGPLGEVGEHDEAEQLFYSAVYDSTSSPCISPTQGMRTPSKSPSPAPEGTDNYLPELSRQAMQPEAAPAKCNEHKTDPTHVAVAAHTETALDHNSNFSDVSAPATPHNIPSDPLESPSRSQNTSQSTSPRSTTSQPCESHDATLLVREPRPLSAPTNENCSAAATSTSSNGLTTKLAPVTSGTTGAVGPFTAASYSGASLAPPGDVAISPSFVVRPPVLQRDSQSASFKRGDKPTGGSQTIGHTSETSGMSNRSGYTLQLPDVARQSSAVENHHSDSQFAALAASPRNFVIQRPVCDDESPPAWENGASNFRTESINDNSFVQSGSAGQGLAPIHRRKERPRSADDTTDIRVQEHVLKSLAPAVDEPTISRGLNASGQRRASHGTVDGDARIAPEESKTAESAGDSRKRNLLLAPDDGAGAKKGTRRSLNEGHLSVSAQLEMVAKQLSKTPTHDDSAGPNWQWQNVVKHSKGPPRKGEGTDPNPGEAQSADNGWQEPEDSETSNARVPSTGHSATAERNRSLSVPISSVPRVTQSNGPVDGEARAQTPPSAVQVNDTQSSRPSALMHTSKRSTSSSSSVMLVPGENWVTKTDTVGWVTWETQEMSSEVELPQKSDLIFVDRSVTSDANAGAGGVSWEIPVERDRPNSIPDRSSPVSHVSTPPAAASGRRTTPGEFRNPRTSGSSSSPFLPSPHDPTNLKVTMRSRRQVEGENLVPDHVDPTHSKARNHYVPAGSSRPARHSQVAAPPRVDAAAITLTVSEGTARKAGCALRTSKSDQTTPPHTPLIRKHASPKFSPSERRPLSAGPDDEGSKVRLLSKCIIFTVGSRNSSLPDC